MKKRMKKRLTRIHKDLVAPTYTKMEREWTEIEQKKSMSKRWYSWLAWFFRGRVVTPPSTIDHSPDEVLSVSGDDKTGV